MATFCLAEFIERYCVLSQSWHQTEQNILEDFCELWRSTTRPTGRTEQDRSKPTTLKAHLRDVFDWLSLQEVPLVTIAHSVGGFTVKDVGDNATYSGFSLNY